MKFFLLTFSLAVFAWQPAASQSTYERGTTVRIHEGDTLAHNVIAAGEMVEVMGLLQNDLYSASRHLIVNGEITDDAVAAAQHIYLHGRVGDMMLGMGETVVVDGNIEGDLFAAGREVRIAGNARIGGNVFIAAASVHFEGGEIDGALRVAGRTITLDGRIGNFTEIYGSDVTFGENYVSAFGTTINSDEPVHRENLGVVPADLTIMVDQPGWWGFLLYKFGLYLSLLITGLVLIRVFKRTSTDLRKFATETFWKNTGVGLLSFLGVPLAAVVLSVMVLTIPLAVILGLLYGLALFTGYLLVAMLLGMMVLLRFREETAPSTPYWGLALGMVVLAVLVNLPFLGWPIHALLLFFGLGSLVRYAWRRSRIAGVQPGGTGGGAAEAGY